MNRELVDLASEDATFFWMRHRICLVKDLLQQPKQRADELKCLKQVQHQKRPFLGAAAPTTIAGAVTTEGTVHFKGVDTKRTCPSAGEVATEAREYSRTADPPCQEKKIPQETLGKRTERQEA